MSRGGPRPGAGRKPGPHPEAAHRTRRMLLLNDVEYQQARDLGDGNASAGVRRALALCSTPLAELPQALKPASLHD